MTASYDDIAGLRSTQSRGFDANAEGKMKLLIGTMIAALLSTACLADDWSGFYAGIIGQLSANQSVTSNGTVTGEFGGSGIGGLAGYRFNAGTLVFGSELVLAGLSAEKLYSSGETFRMAFSGDARATVGLPVGAFLPYVAAGLSVTSGTVLGNGFNGSATHFGASIAAGIETKLSQNISVRAEISRTEYGLGDYGPWFGGQVWIHPANTSIDIGLIYSF